MHVDDRLATVLAVRATGENQIRIQYRQLLDLVGTTPADVRSDVLDGALLRLAELAQALPVDERVRAVSEPGLRLRNPRLVADLAQDHPRVALAAMTQARLSEEQWLDLLPALPASTRPYLASRNDLGPVLRQRLAQLGAAPAGLPVSSEAQAAGEQLISATAEGVAPDAMDTGVVAGDGIGAIVRRIAAYRRNRDTAVAANDAPQLPLTPEIPSAPIQAITFACDPDGRIVSADAAVAGMTVGLLLPGVTDPTAPTGARFVRRQPIRLIPVVLQGAPRIAGDWVLDAAPEFDPGGRFTGYVGKLRRPAPAAPAAAPAPEADRLRQVLHELRTPVNAIQGFAELIHQQLVGPVPHGYRAVAAGIAADAAQMLAGFDELERLVKLDGGALSLPDGQCDLVPILTRLDAQLAPYTTPRHSGFLLQLGPEPMPVGLAEAEAERLLWRVMATFASLAAPGEVLPLALARRGDTVALELAMPAVLAEAADPLDPAPPLQPQPVSGSQFGSGFALRLACAEATAAGGELALADGKALLLLPFAGAERLTEPFGLSNPAAQVRA